MLGIPDRVIARTVLASTATSVVLTVVLPSDVLDAQHLIAKAKCAFTGGAGEVVVELDGDSTGANYHSQYIEGAVSTDAAAIQNGAAWVSIRAVDDGGSADRFSSGELLIFDAFSTSKMKSILCVAGENEDRVRITSGRYSATPAAVGTVTFSGGTFAIGSVFELKVPDEMFAIPGAQDRLAADGTFNLQGIPQLDGDIILLADLRSDDAATDDEYVLQQNGDTTAGNYKMQELRGAGVSTDSIGTGTHTAIYPSMPGDSAAANIFAGHVWRIPQHADADDDPETFFFGGGHYASGSAQAILASLRRDNSEAVTDLQLTPSAGTNFISGSMLSAYFVPKMQIAYKKLAANASTVVLALPSGWRDAELCSLARSAVGATLDGLNVQINSDSTAANYDRQQLNGKATTVAAAQSAASREIAEIPGDSATANVFGGSVTHIPEYAKTDRHKELLTMYGAGEAAVGLISHRWESPDAIALLTISAASGDLMAGSVFRVYGIGRDALGWEDLLGHFEAIAEIDTGADESFGAVIDDLTADGQLAGLSTMIGRSFPSTLTGQSVTGRLDLQMLNYDGDFSFYETNSPYAGLLKAGTFTRLRCESPVARTLWFGSCTDIPADISDSQEKSAAIAALGPFHEFSKDSLRVQGQANVLSHLALVEVLDKANFSATRRTIGTGKATIPHWFIPDKKKTLTVIRELEATEGNAIIREGENGHVVFEPEGDRLTIRGQTSQAVFSDAPGAGELKLRKISFIKNPDQNVYNDIRRKYRKYSAGSSAVMWTAPVDQTIPAGEERTFVVQIPNQTTLAINQNIMAIDPTADWVTPVIGTDITASASAGGGTDMNGDLSLGTIEKFSNAMIIPITNGGTVTAFLSLLQARGTPLEVSDPIEVRDEDAVSIAQNDRHTFPNPKAIWVENAEEAHSANLIDLAVWKDPTSVIRLEYEADSDAYRMAAAVRLTLSDRITVRDSSYYGIDEDFYIENIKRAISPRTESGGVRVDRMVVSYDLSPAAGFSDFFIWGFSKWGISTKASRS